MHNVEAILKKAQEKFHKTKEVFSNSIIGISVKPNANFFNAVRAEIYGNHMPISSCATIRVSVPEKTFFIQAHDSNNASIIYKAIQAANLGLTTTIAGDTIKAVLPPMSTERRSEMGKVITKAAEDSKISARNIRREENDALKKLLKDKVISSDIASKYEEKIQKETDVCIKDIDKMADVKINEIMNF